MCSCVYVRVCVCVVNALCLKDCIHCSLIRDGSGTRGLKILQSLGLIVSVCEQMYLSVCVVSLVPHFSSPTSVWISMVSKSGSKFWSVCISKATNKLRLLFLSWHTSHAHTHTHIYSIKKHYEWLVHQQSRPELRAMFRGWVDKWSLSNSPPCRSPAANILSTPALPTCELQSGSFSMHSSPLGLNPAPPPSHLPPVAIQTES